jgi:hypothetical protein
MTLPSIGVWPAEALQELGFVAGGRFEGVELEDHYHALLAVIVEEQGFRTTADVPSAPGLLNANLGVSEHRLLDWPRHVQGDVLPEFAEFYPDSLAAAGDANLLAKRSLDWTLLLQLVRKQNLSGEVLAHAGEQLPEESLCELAVHAVQRMPRLTPRYRNAAAVRAAGRSGDGSRIARDRRPGK